MSLWEMSCSGAVLIVVIALIRALTVHRLPKKTFLALWAVTLARLFLPFSLPSALSVYTLAERLTPKGIVSAAPAAPLKQAVFVTDMAPAAPTAATLPPAVEPWTAVWAVGMLACALFFAVSYLRCRRQFDQSLPVEHPAAADWLAEHPLRRKVAIRCSDRISAPLTYGVLRPVILMPKTTDWADTAALGYMLAHEHIHIRRLDALTKLALAAALCVHWFNPAVWLLYVLANRDLELSCDEAVIRRFGANSRSAYAMTLIRMEETRSGLRPLSSGFSKNAIEERIVAIMKLKRTSAAALLAAATLVLGVTVTFATSSVPDDPARLTATVSANLETPEPPAATAFSWPVPGYTEVTTGYTSRVDPLDGTEYVHSGEDIAAPAGTPVVAALAGTVSETGFDAQRGNYVLLTHDEGKTSLYAHLKDVAVSQGDQVAQGGGIGTVGNSGMSTGPHLHFALSGAEGEVEALLSLPALQ